MKLCLLLGISRGNNKVSRVEETEKKTGVVGDFQEEEQELENFHVQSTGEKELKEDTESGSRISQPSDRNRKNINPVGPDSRTLTCKSCGSYHHLLHACPDSWENMAKINIAEKEHAVLFTGYNTEEVQRLGIDARNCAVLDSACNSTVCGDKWINNYIQSLDNSDRLKIKQRDSQRVSHWTTEIDSRSNKEIVRECLIGQQR